LDAVAAAAALVLIPRSRRRRRAAAAHGCGGRGDDGRRHAGVARGTACRRSSARISLPSAVLTSSIRFSVWYYARLVHSHGNAAPKIGGP